MSIGSAARPGLGSRGLPSGRTEKIFREDIGALRALAAVVVILFHFGVPGFGGGYIGVDIFFVISGLLMTQIVERGIDGGRFSIWGFYAARIRRVMPGLVVLCTVLLLAGTVYIDPLTLGDTARNALASMLFYSNMLYAAQGGYFAGSSDANWLLHTWTLSVEWQFYLIYPVLLALAARWRWLWARRAATLGIACLIAFVATMVIAGHSASLQQYAFYLLPTRAWEMLAGGWLALAAPRISSRLRGSALLAAGLAVVIASACLFDSTLPWPSVWMALPVAGTASILAVARHGAVWARLPGVEQLGTWSYSLYLWHWPVVVSSRYFNVEYGTVALILGLAATLILAIASYELVEVRLRRWLFGEGKTSHRRWIGIAAAMSVLVAFAGVTARYDGFEGIRTAGLNATTRARLADYRAAPADWQGMAPCGGGKRFGTGRSCTLSTGHPQRIAVIGDSHAEQMLPRFARLAAENPIEINLMRQQGCPPLPDLRWTASGSQCGRFAGQAFDAVERGHYPRVIVLAAWALYFGHPGGVEPGALSGPTWAGYRPLTDPARIRAAIDTAFDGFTERLQRLEAGGAQVTIVLPGPIPGDETPRDFYRQSFDARAAFTPAPIDRAAYLARTSRVRALLARAAARSGADLFDPVPARCGPKTCPVFDGGEYVFKDTHHYRASMVTRPGFGYLDPLFIADCPMLAQPAGSAALRCGKVSNRLDSYREPLVGRSRGQR